MFDKEADPTSVAPHLAASVFALDHASASDRIRTALRAGKDVYLDRFVDSNAAHQGAKIGDSAERRHFIAKLYGIEHEDLQVPRPDVTFLLDLPAAVSRARAFRRAEAEGRRLDGHETNLGYQERVRSTFLELADRESERFEIIDCLKDGVELGVPEIHAAIWSKMQERLRTVA